MVDILCGSTSITPSGSPRGSKTKRRFASSSSTSDANLTTDSHLAALAISHGATLVSFDNDFARFPNLRRTHPGRRK